MPGLRGGSLAILVVGGHDFVKRIGINPEKVMMQSHGYPHQQGDVNSAFAHDLIDIGAVAKQHPRQPGRGITPARHHPRNFIADMDAGNKIFSTVTFHLMIAFNSECRSPRHGHQSGPKEIEARTRLQHPEALRMPMRTNKSRPRNNRTIRSTCPLTHQ